MTPAAADVPELRVKSVERVRELGEVLTPAQTVAEMLDLPPDEIRAIHPSAASLEPACCDGNFLVVILERKLQRIEAAAELAAGEGDAGS